MKILIADDQARRYGRLIDGLGSLGVERQDVEIVASANEARTRLESGHYDLLILDILLPLWPEGDPDAQHSLDLLFEVSQTDALNRPGRVLGISADQQTADSAEAEFSKGAWTVVRYSASNDDWLNCTLNCVAYIQGEKRKKDSLRPVYGVDLAIICALEKPELEEVLKLPWNWKSSRPIDDVTFVHDGHFESGGRAISVCATFAPRMGMVSTALRSAAIISLLRPRLIAMCGICAGVRGKVNYGDVILADPAWDFQSGKRVRDKKNTQFSFSPHHLPVHVSIRAHIEQLRSEKGVLASLAADYPHDLSERTIPNIVVGPLASGSAVLADGEVIKEIKGQHRDLVGVEMEAYGLYAAADFASEPKPRALALKAVCDFADPDKDDKYQRYAAYTSANVLRLLMEKYATRLLG